MLRDRAEEYTNATNKDGELYGYNCAELMLNSANSQYDL